MKYLEKIVQNSESCEKLSLPFYLFYYSEGCNRIIIFQFLGDCCKIFSVSAMDEVCGKRELRFRVSKKGTLLPCVEKLIWEEVLWGSWVHLQQRI